MSHSLKTDHTLPKILFRGENNEGEDHFWKVFASIPLPTFSSNPSWFDPNPFCLNILDYEKPLTRGETLPRKPQGELRVYFRRKYPHDSEHQPTRLC